ncbi:MULTISPECIES: polysaccharide deacetylase [Tatumella]|uniref:Polysaccharide deacetylase n=1 Tax=Tatumella punctata TaxID=399969 RepID=A0ABW1VJ75_9GAMM|nr:MULTISPECIES: polysaccharide deacetylase [unclassified Tatumella]MBS0857408.1 polysaccharide deacetylase [Tatumella sp. JGM16]MBS0877292.1 polysaccharide deacetylase [Tatumella sp. JGM82]MBS0890835.1 polysaccharide deacetylase [Tatumella sp. JGM94]MBS0893378.1 polysaccharide deacetylase [Tatumella sp. JGM130]MBS0901689.1 polysaccharide deacetylase [Tatumella sp. JGM100]
MTQNADLILTLNEHHRYPSTDKNSASFSWPGGHGLAIYVAMNLEHFSFGCSEGAKISQVANSLDILNYSWRDYGNRVGGWHLAGLFEKLSIPPAVIANSSILEHYPELLQRWTDLPGSELIGHGYTNSQRQGDLDEEEESYLISYCQQQLTQYQNQKVSGWLSPWISESHNTPDLLKQHGFDYSLNWAHDDRPVPINTRHGELLSIPYPQEINDIPTIIPNGTSIDIFCQMIKDQFAELLERSKFSPQVMGIALHPYIVGQPFRFYQLKKTLAELILQQNEFWLTTPGEIARYYRSSFPE